MVAIGEPARIIYTNYRGETAERTITPKRVWFGISDWHQEPQWFVTAFDHDKNADRDFALRDFGSASLRPGLEVASRWHEAEAERKRTVAVKSRRLGAQIATHEVSATALANYEARTPSALEPDWVHIARMAGKFGIRYQTNHEFVDFLKAIRALSSPDHADAGKSIEWDGLQSAAISNLIEAAKEEAAKAMRKFPQPNYIISKIAEEAGEVIKAAIHCAEGRENPEAVIAEIKQTFAMLFRLLLEGDEVHGLSPLLPSAPSQEVVGS